MRHSKSEPSQRQLRVGEQMRHSISRTLQREFFRDPDLSDASSITVTEVRISPDLRNATAFVMRLGGGDMAPTLEALNRASAFFRSKLSKDMRLKFTPNIRFKTDNSFDNAAHIQTILEDERVSRDLAADTDENPGTADKETE